jgi:ribosomal protein L24
MPGIEDAQQLRSQILELTRDYATRIQSKLEFTPGETNIPVSGKVLSPEDFVSLVDSSLDGWLTTGRFNAEFEKKLATFIGIKHLITVNSGSSANLVAFNTLTSPKLGDRAIKKGDEVIVITGKDRGKVGKVKKILPLEFRVLVAGINTITKANKNKDGDDGNFIKQESYLHTSNVLLLDVESLKPNRVGFKFLDNGQKVRFLKKSGKILSEIN